MTFRLHQPTIAAIDVLVHSGLAPKPGRPPHPFEVFLPAGAAGNPVDSIILPHQIRTISAGRLRQRYGQLNDTALRRESPKKSWDTLDSATSSSPVPLSILGLSTNRDANGFLILM